MKTKEFPDWTTVLLSDSLTVTNAFFDGGPVTCTENVVTNLTVQATDFQSNGHYSFSAGPYVQYTYTTGGGCPDFTPSIGLFSSQVVYDKNGNVGDSYVWSPSFSLASIIGLPGQTMSVQYQMTFYSSLWTNTTVKENKSTVYNPGVNTLFELIDLTGILAG
ncbi:MAG: hypothetical protein WBW47_01815 [Thermoplasmata archaeon]